MVAPWTARRTVEHLGRNRLAVPAALLMLLLQDEEARAQVWHATAPSNSAHNYGTYGVDPLWWTPWSALAALPVRSQASIGNTHCLLRWSFWRSFHQALLHPTRPHWPESRPNLTCLEPTGTGSAEYGQLSPKQRRTRRRASRLYIPDPPPNHIRRRRRTWSGGVEMARQDDRSMPRQPAFGRVVDIATRPARPG
jgi:hypothetical protein